MEEEKSITKSDFTEVLGKFTEDVLLPAIGRLIDNSADSVKEELRVEIKISEQANKDWTNKRVGEAEGRIIPKINTLTNVLEEKGVISTKQAGIVKRAGISI